MHAGKLPVLPKEHAQRLQSRMPGTVMSMAVRIVFRSASRMEKPSTWATPSAYSTADQILRTAVHTRMPKTTSVVRESARAESVACGPPDFRHPGRPCLGAAASAGDRPGVNHARS